MLSDEIINHYFGLRKRLRSLWDMYEFEAYDFFKISQLLTSIDEYSTAHSNESLNDSVAKQQIIDRIQEIIDRCSKMGELGASVICAREMLEWLGDDRQHSFRDISRQAAELRDTIRRELQSKLTFTLSAPEVEHYTNFRKGWEFVYVRFPETLGDIEEGAVVK